MKAKEAPPLSLTVVPVHETCLQFDTRASLDERKAAWRRVLAQAFEEDRAAFLGWVVGEDAPPTTVVQESRAQMRCLLAELLKQEKAAKKALAFLDVAPGTIRQAIMKAKKSGEISGRLERRIIISNHRTAAGQAGMWRSRGNFSAPYNKKVPSHLRKKCQKGQAVEPRRCLRQAVYEIREQKLLRGTAAPGLSRHHWGTEYDLFAVNSRKFRDHGPLGPAYNWLRRNAHRYGFFQTYLGQEEPGYIAERWHWSYSPVSQPLLALLRTHEDTYARALDNLWEGLYQRWNRPSREPTPFFSFVRKYWREFAYSIGPDWPSEQGAGP